MQRLNLLTLAAFLLGLAAFIYDVSTPRPDPLVVEASVDSLAFAADTPISLD